MMNWTVAIAPDVLKSRLQTGTLVVAPRVRATEGGGGGSSYVDGELVSE